MDNDKIAKVVEKITAYLDDKSGLTVEESYIAATLIQQSYLDSLRYDLEGVEEEEEEFDEEDEEEPEEDDVEEEPRPKEIKSVPEQKKSQGKPTSLVKKPIIKKITPLQIDNGEF